MTVYQNRLLVRPRLQPVGVYRGTAPGLQHVHVFQPGLAEEDSTEFG